MVDVPYCCGQFGFCLNGVRANNPPLDAFPWMDMWAVVLSPLVHVSRLGTTFDGTWRALLDLVEQSCAWAWPCSRTIKVCQLGPKWRKPELLQGCPPAACLRWRRTLARWAVSSGMFHLSLRRFGLGRLQAKVKNGSLERQLTPVEADASSLQQGGAGNLFTDADPLAPAAQATPQQQSGSASASSSRRWMTGKRAKI